MDGWAVKTEFVKFGEILRQTQKKLQEASNTIDDAEREYAAIARKLRDVETLPEADADKLLTSEPRLVYDADADAPPEAESSDNADVDPPQSREGRRDA